MSDFCQFCERKEGDICDVINCPHDPRRQPAPSQTGTPRAEAADREVERARLHGPDQRTLDALELTLARAKAAEQDFIQVHKNCIEARERAEKAELALSQAKRDAERLVKLLVEARDNLIWCGGSADFGHNGQAKIGYDKGPRVTITAIADELDAALAKHEGEGKS